MPLSKQLVLCRYILNQFGFDDFEELRDGLNAVKPGHDATGRSYFTGYLLGKPKPIDEQSLLGFDETIKGYEERLRRNRGEPFFTFKYFQYLALLFTEFYFDRISVNRNAFILSLNQFKNADENFTGIEDFLESDLKKLAYWMATGSGKTLIMHCNYWQMRRYFNDIENIILITPNEGLSRQHYESFKKSDIPAKRYSGSEESLKTEDGQVLILEITKLVKDKEGEGVSVDVDYFCESRNLVFIDEGHKGQRSVERAWKTLREHITRGKGSFTFEYSATFGQIITHRTVDLLNEYGKSIVFDYSYRHFYSDGYGKDFAVYNINARNDYSEAQTRLLLTAGLLGFYEQTTLFEKHRDELRPYNIEKPLWVFVGSKVIGGRSSTLTKTDEQSMSDVTRILRFFQNALSSPEKLQEDMDGILEGRAGLVNTEGEDIFERRFKYLKQTRPDASKILNAVFHGVGGLEACEIKSAEGEIGLRTHLGKTYFAVIHIGDVPRYIKKLRDDGITDIQIEDDNFSKSLFHDISASASSVNILIGSKKFIEGWNSWRVSSMGLLNMGMGEGPQIIQLFGRGVRLKGKELSLKREDADAPYQIRTLQTISIFGLNASYMNHFLKSIEKEAPDYRELAVAIRLNREDEWDGKVMTFEADKEHRFKDAILDLEASADILERVAIDLRTKINVAEGGFNNQVAEDAETYQDNLLNRFFEWIDFNALSMEINRYKLLRGYTNLIIQKGMLDRILKSPGYRIFSYAGQIGPLEAVSGKVTDIAASVLKDYMNKFYADKEKDYLTRYGTLRPLTAADYPELFPKERKMVVKAPREYADEVEKIVQDMEKFYRQDVDDIPTIHFDHHLYSPIAAWRKGKRFQSIKTAPIKLNEGETRFLNHLRTYLRTMADRLKGKEIFILRNLAQRGVGFFMESASFYPDFILWIVEGTKQSIYFLDPKGIRMLGNFNDDKIVFCTRTIHDINESIRQRNKREDAACEISLDAFILSVSDFEDIRRSWGDAHAEKEDFRRNHILFVDDDKGYLNEIFKKALDANPS